MTSSWSAVKLLISYGGSVNQRDCNGNTPLHLGKVPHVVHLKVWDWDCGFSEVGNSWN